MNNMDLLDMAEDKCFDIKKVASLTCGDVTIEYCGCFKNITISMDKLEDEPVELDDLECFISVFQDFIKILKGNNK